MPLWLHFWHVRSRLLLLFHHERHACLAHRPQGLLWSWLDNHVRLQKLKRHRSMQLDRQSQELIESRPRSLLLLLWSCRQKYLNDGWMVRWKSNLLLHSVEQIPDFLIKSRIQDGFLRHRPFSPCEWYLQCLNTHRSVVCLSLLNTLHLL